MPYRIEWLPAARRQFRKLPRAAAERLFSLVDSLAENPRPPESRKLEGTEDCYRLRQGDCRVVYTILEDCVVVLVLRVGHRSSAYRGTSDLTRAIKKHRRRPGSS